MKRSCLVLSFACLLLAGCEADKPSGPATPETPLPPVSASAPIALPKEAPSAPTAAPTEQAAAPSATTSATAAAPHATGTASAAAAAAGAASGMPTTKNGVLDAGAADRVLKTGAKTVVRLVEPGAEPRAVAAYAFSVGAVQSAVMGLDMVMGAKSGGMDVPRTTVPHLAMTLELNPAEKNPASDVRVSAKVTDVAVEPNGITQTKIAESLRPQVAGAKGMTIGCWVSPQGTVRDVKAEMPATMPAEAAKMLQSVNQSFESIFIALPKEAIGTGARWQVISRVSSQGADILEYRTYTLKSREGGRLSLSTSVKQFAAKAVVDNPMIPAGMTARIKRFDSGGTGDTELDVADIAPLSSKLLMKSSMEIEVGKPGAPGDSNTVETELTLTFARPTK